MTLEQLLEQARGMRSDVLYVVEEKCVGDIMRLPPRLYWAHTAKKAFTGETPEELLADILASAKEEAA